MAQEISLETLAGAKAREVMSGEPDTPPAVESIQEEKQCAPSALSRKPKIPT